MNTCRTMPNCLGAMNDGSDNSGKQLHHRKGIYQPFLMRNFVPVPDTHLLAFAEAALAPIKYALFHSCGRAFIHSMGIAFQPGPITTPLKIGAFGGAILAFFYVTLLARTKSTTQPPDEHPTIWYAVNLLKEIMYSILAAYLGVTGCGLSDEMTFFLLAGALGPIVASIAIVSFVGLVVVIVWCAERFWDWRAGY